MKTELKDVINFYLGCEMISKKGTIWILAPSNFPNNWKDSYFLTSKPLLRPLSDMTEEEAVEVTKPIVIYGYTEGRSYEAYRNSFGKIVVSWGISHLEKYVPQSELHFTTEQFIYLIKQGFDIFGLIDSSQAVDKTKIV